MDGIRGGCPNCENDLATERIVTQAAGDRQIRLHWMKCTRCGHIALYDWEFLDESARDRESTSETDTISRVADRHR